MVQIPEESLANGNVNISDALTLALEGLQQSQTATGTDKVGLIGNLIVSTCSITS